MLLEGKGNNGWVSSLLMARTKTFAIFAIKVKIFYNIATWNRMHSGQTDLKIFVLIVTILKKLAYEKVS